MAWEHGNLKTDTNTNYNITLFSSANIGRNAEKIYRKSRLRKKVTVDVKGI